MRRLQVVDEELRRRHRAPPAAARRRRARRRARAPRPAGRPPGRRARATRRRCRDAGPRGRRPSRWPGRCSPACWRTSGSWMTSWWVVIAPMTRWSPSSRTPRISATRPTSTSDLGVGQPQSQQRDQRLAAGQHLGVVAVLAPARRPPRRPSRRARSRTAPGSCCPPPAVLSVLRRRRRSCPGGTVAAIATAAALASWIARHTRSGVHAIRTSSTPNCRSASTTALTTAGVDAMVPASPTPLTPSGLVVDGVSVRSVAKDGRSGGAGTR